MAKYGKGSQKKVKKVMREYKKGKLKSGSGRKVKNRKQAIAIGLSEARKSGAKAPKKSSSTKSRGSSKSKAASKSRGSSNGVTKEQLYKQAQKRNIEGRSKMTKAQLQRALAR
jgi:hypothetical protein